MRALVKDMAAMYGLPERVSSLCSQVKELWMDNDFAVDIKMPLPLPPGKQSLTSMLPFPLLQLPWVFRCCAVPTPVVVPTPCCGTNLLWYPVLLPWVSRCCVRLTFNMMTPTSGPCCWPWFSERDGICPGILEQMISVVTLTFMPGTWMMGPWLV